MVSLIHTDKSEARCVLHRDHQQDDSAHMDEHGCLAAVLVHQSSIREAEAVAARQREAEREKRYQPVTVRFPVELYDRLKAYADAHYRSLGAQVLACVDRDLNRQMD